MIRINQLKLPITHSDKALEKKVLLILRVPEQDIIDLQITKRSIDARKKPDLFYVYCIDVKVKNEEKLLKKNIKNVQFVKEIRYAMPLHGEELLSDNPCVIGAGPAGLFSAFLLAEMGYKPIVFERGKAVEDRKKDVEEFWKTGVLNTESNVQFGEGGAGAFSDGKLNTVVKDPSGRNRFVLETFVRFGAPEQIMYDAKPHIGTDILEIVLVNMRNYLIEKGCTFAFSHMVSDFIFEKNELKALVVNGQEVKCSACILAPGHSSRDTFETLYHKNISMEAKQFAVGFRVEHPQAMINDAQYGENLSFEMPAAPYKVTSNFPNGRGVYSFCMCPGGYVVNSSSEENSCVVNGMSYGARDSKNANSAIIVSVGPEDFGASDPLAGVRFQRNLEKRCYELGKGKVPQQLFGDFCENKMSQAYGDYSSVMKGQTCFSNLRGLLSQEIEESFIEGMHHFGKIISNFDRKDAIMSGVESRTSSPLRILRDENFESSVKGLYPCGEGAGYAGGIMSAAIDGLKVAEAIVMRYKPME